MTGIDDFFAFEQKNATFSEENVAYPELGIVIF